MVPVPMTRSLPTTFLLTIISVPLGIFPMVSRSLLLLESKLSTFTLSRIVLPSFFSISDSVIFLWVPRAIISSILLSGIPLLFSSSRMTGIMICWGVCLVMSSMRMSAVLAFSASFLRGGPSIGVSNASFRDCDGSSRLGHGFLSIVQARFLFGTSSLIRDSPYRRVVLMLLLLWVVFVDKRCRGWGFCIVI